MRSTDEKQAFAERLKQALKRSPKKVQTATELAIQFSLRHPDAAITTQAAQKWLTGKAMPTLDKIDTLAEWLDVSPAWLRHGVADSTRRTTQPGKIDKPEELSENERVLLCRLRALPEARRNLVEGIVEQFALDAEVWR